MAVSKCDVLFSIGTRFNDRITGDLNEFAPKAKIVHIDVDTASISQKCGCGCADCIRCESGIRKAARMGGIKRHRSSGRERDRRVG